MVLCHRGRKGNPELLKILQRVNAEGKGTFLLRINEGQVTVTLLSL